MTRPMRVVGFVLVLYGALSGALAGPAAAHAELIRTTPSDGQRLDRAPAHVVLEFTERVALTSGGVRLLDAAGRAVATPEPHVVGQRVMLPLPADLPRGGYVLSWRVASSVTAVLVNTQPGRPARGAVEAAPTQVSLQVPDGGTAELPATVGQNDVHIAVLDVAGRPRAVAEATRTRRRWTGVRPPVTTTATPAPDLARTATPAPDLARTTTPQFQTRPSHCGADPGDRRAAPPRPGATARGSG